MTITNAAGCPVACPIEVVHWVLPVAIFNYLLPGTVTPTSCQPDGPCWLDQYCEDISGNFAYRSFVPTRQLLNVFTSCIQRHEGSSSDDRKQFRSSKKTRRPN